MYYSRCALPGVCASKWPRTGFCCFFTPFHPAPRPPPTPHPTPQLGALLPRPCPPCAQPAPRCRQSLACPGSQRSSSWRGSRFSRTAAPRRLEATRLGQDSPRCVDAGTWCSPGLSASGLCPGGFRGSPQAFCCSFVCPFSCQTGVDWTAGVSSADGSTAKTSRTRLRGGGGHPLCPRLTSVLLQGLPPQSPGHLSLYACLYLCSYFVAAVYFHYI